MSTERKVNLVGLKEIAVMLEVGYETVTKWRVREVLPEPDFMVSGTAIWYRSSISAWARSTGRLTSKGPQKLTGRVGVAQPSEVSA